MHHLHLEHFAAPGKVLIGGDSHTVAAGGIGSFSVGVGRFDNAMAIAGEPFYLTMPKIVKVNLTGKLQSFVSAKNVIMAKSFARLHLANLVNWGMLPLVFKNDEDYKSINQDDLLEVESSDLKECKDVKVINKTKNKVYYLTTLLFQQELDAIKEGGFVNILKNKNK